MITTNILKGKKGDYGVEMYTLFWNGFSFIDTIYGPFCGMYISPLV